MNIVLEMTVTEYKLQTKGFWREVSETYTWIAYSLMLIVAAFVFESSITFPEQGAIKVAFGGPVSWFGLAGAVGLMLYARRKNKHAADVVRRPAGDKIVFIRFSNFGIEYGIRDVWTSSYSWSFVIRVHTAPHFIDFEHIYGQLRVRTEAFKPHEMAELKDLFARQRNEILPEPFFGWRRSTPGKQSYGPVKQ